jgi:hypothetical protein
MAVRSLDNVHRNSLSPNCVSITKLCLSLHKQLSGVPASERDEVWTGIFAWKVEETVTYLRQCRWSVRSLFCMGSYLAALSEGRNVEGSTSDFPSHHGTSPSQVINS